MILLDTNVVSEFMKPSPSEKVMTWFDAHEFSDVYISAVTEAELWLGLYTMPHGKRRSALETQIFATLNIDFSSRSLVFNSEAAVAYGEIFARRKSLGRPILMPDCQIASIAQVNGLTLATRNTADFEHCGIGLVNPFA